MDNLPNIDKETAAVVRQITAEVKSGKPITITHKEVDVILMNKLFHEKRYVAGGNGFEVPSPTQITPPPIKKRKPAENDELIDHSLMKVLFRDGKHDDILPSSCSPSPPLLPNEIIRSAYPPPAIGTITNYPKREKDLFFLQKKLLETQIEKDRVITQYYRRKLELLEQQKND